MYRPLCFSCIMSPGQDLYNAFMTSDHRLHVVTIYVLCTLCIMQDDCIIAMMSYLYIQDLKSFEWES